MLNCLDILMQEIIFSGNDSSLFLITSVPNILGFHCHAIEKKKIETIPWMKSRNWHGIEDK